MKIQITDLKKAVTSLDRLLESLQQVRRQLENAIHPPEILVCTACLCSWAGTTHDAIWNDGDQEYRCPECGSSEVSMFDTETAGDLVDYLAEKQAEKLRSVINTVRGVTLFQPHTTPQIEESLAAAFADAEADFLAQYEVTTCPYCGEETALITPGGRVVCSCWTNPAQEVVEDLQQADAPQWEFFHEENLPGEWPEELGVHLRRQEADGVEVRVIPYPDSLSIEFLDPEGTPYEAEMLVTAAPEGRVQIQIQSADERIAITEGDHR